MGSTGQDYTTNKLSSVSTVLKSNPLVHFNTGEVYRIRMEKDGVIWYIYSQNKRLRILTSMPLKLLKKQTEYDDFAKLMTAVS